MNTRRKVTLSLPDRLLRRFRLYAAARNQSMDRLMAKAIENLMGQGDCGAVAKRRFLNRIHNAPDRGTKGKIRWTRDELYKR